MTLPLPRRLSWYQPGDDGQTFTQRSGTVWAKGGNRSEPGLQGYNFYWVFPDGADTPLLVGPPAEPLPRGIGAYHQPTLDGTEPDRSGPVLVCLAFGDQIQSMTERFQREYGRTPIEDGRRATRPTDRDYRPASFQIDGVDVTVTEQDGAWRWAWNRQHEPWTSPNRHEVERDDQEQVRHRIWGPRGLIRISDAHLWDGPGTDPAQRQPGRVDDWVRSFIGWRHDIGMENHASRVWGDPATVHLSQIEEPGRCNCDPCLAGDHELTRAATADLTARIDQQQAQRPEANPHQVAAEVLIPALADLLVHIEAAEHTDNRAELEQLRYRRQGIDYQLGRHLADPEAFEATATAMAASAWFPYYGGRNPDRQTLALHHSQLDQTVKAALARPDLVREAPDRQPVFQPPAHRTAAETGVRRGPGSPKHR